MTKNTGDHNSGENNSEVYNSGWHNSGSNNSGISNSGDYNSGSNNSGDRNNGWFNTNQSRMRFFNKLSNYTYDEFRKSGKQPSLSEFKFNVWIGEEKMTDTEKTKNPNYKTTNGCLKTIKHKEAWAIFWKETSEENRQKFLNLPNFDAEIFEEITGVKVNEQNEVVEVTMDEIAEKMGIDIKNLRIKDE